MPSENTTKALLRSTVDESFGGIVTLQAGFDSAINRFVQRAQDGASPITMGLAANVRDVAVQAHADIRRACGNACASCRVPEETDAGRLLRERLAGSATWMHMALDRIAAAIDPAYSASAVGDHLLLSTEGTLNTSGFDAPVRDTDDPTMSAAGDGVLVIPSGDARGSNHLRPQSLKRRAPPSARSGASPAAAAPKPLSASQLAVAGQIASSPYALGAEQEFAVTRPATATKYEHVKSRVGEAIRGMSSSRSVLDNAPLDPFSNEALQRKLHQVTAGVTSGSFTSDWEAIDRDATITDRRVATPAKDARLEALLRNLPSDRRDHVLYESAMRDVAKANARPQSGAPTALRAPPADEGEPPSSSDAGEMPKPRAALSSSTAAMPNHDAGPIAAEMNSFGSGPRVQSMREAARRGRGRPASAAAGWTASTGGLGRGTRSNSVTRRPATAAATPARASPATATATASGGRTSATTPAAFRDFVQQVREERARDNAENISSGSHITLNVTSGMPPPRRNVAAPSPAQTT